MRLRRSRRAPRVTVVIASYRWPEALRLSLESALAQTVEDIEVLVIEDGDDRASRPVVRDVRDRRARWLSLQPGSGNQSGPNMLGIREARAPVIAYLGHDDLWHPDHLTHMLAALESGSDVAHAVTLLLPSDDGGFLEIAGSRTWDETMFVPPSSLAHLRDSPRVGRWISSGSSGVPIDYSWLIDCQANGARFATTGEPTVFKFVAARRLDSYITRDIAAQIQLRDRLAADRDAGHKILAEALAAGVAPTIAAPPTTYGPGVIADYNRRMKGLPAMFGEPVSSWTPDPILAFRGWHAPERDAHGPFAWTGAEERAFVRLDAPGDGALGVAIAVRHVVEAEQLERLVVELDGTVVELERGPAQDDGLILTGWLDRPSHGRTVEVGLATTRVTPSLRDSSSPDERALGLAVAEIVLLDRK